MEKKHINYHSLTITDGSSFNQLYLFESLQQGWGDGGHVEGMESNTSTTDFLCKDSLLFQLQHKFTDCFLSKHTHTHILVKTYLRKKIKSQCSQVIVTL